jgi:undecaprenyl-diphosphatase
MDLGYSILKGVIQGLTEFLPVSSTAHLTFANAIFERFHWQPPLRPGEDEFFDILLHLGTLLSVVYYFRADLWRLLLVALGKAPGSATDSQSGLSLRQLPVYLAISSVATVVFVLGVKKISGFVMAHMGWATASVQDLSDYYFAHPYWVAIHLMIVGGLLFFTEKMSASLRTGKRGQTGQRFTRGNALVIGLVQGCAAIFHGISRSGSTIAAGLASGVDRVTATRYTILLSIPTFLMAAVYEALKLKDHMLDLNWPVMLVGAACSAVLGYLCVKYLIRYVATHSLAGFAYYCWALGLIMLALLMTAPPVPAAS